MTFPDEEELANMDVDDMRAMLGRMKQREGKVAKKTPVVDLDEDDDASDDDRTVLPEPMDHYSDDEEEDEEDEDRDNDVDDPPVVEEFVLPVEEFEPCSKRKTKKATHPDYKEAMGKQVEAASRKDGWRKAKFLTSDGKWKVMCKIVYKSMYPKWWARLEKKEPGK